MKNKMYMVLGLTLITGTLLSGCGHEHEYGEWTVTTPATCTEEGVEERSCTKGDDTESRAIPATGHTFGEWTVLTEASCVAEGQQEHTCTVCGEKETETIPVQAAVTETDYVSIDGIYVDTSYSDSDNASLKMVYVFYTAKTNAENIKISSKSSKIKFDGANEYTSEKYGGVCKYMGSYYYSDYLEEVYVGTELKVVSTFKVPEGELAAGRSISLEPYGIPDAEKLMMATDSIVSCSSEEEIAQAVDPEGYADYQDKYTEADSDTTKKVRSALNGYYWSFYVNSTSYQIEFYSPNKFETRVKAFGVSNDGTYVVRNGFISCTYDSNGTTVDIPWSWKSGDIDLDVTTAFDVH